jgi:DNA-binding MarR family transcriptional regulator
MHALYSNKTNNMKELANETRMSKQYLSNIIKVLVKKGIVRRERALHDRRVVMISPTSTGRTLLENITKEALASLADKLVPFHDEDLIVLNSVVTRLVSLIDEEIVSR